MLLPEIEGDLNWEKSAYVPYEAVGTHAQPAKQGGTAHKWLQLHLFWSIFK